MRAQALLAETWQAADPATMCPSLGLGCATEMLTHAVAPLMADARDKDTVVTAISAIVAAQVSQHEEVKNASQSVVVQAQRLRVDALQGRCMVWLSVWMLQPHVQPEAVEELMGVLTDALASCQ